MRLKKRSMHTYMYREISIEKVRAHLNVTTQEANDSHDCASCICTSKLIFFFATKFYGTVQSVRPVNLDLLFKKMRLAYLLFVFLFYFIIKYMLYEIVTNCIVFITSLITGP